MISSSPPTPLDNKQYENEMEVLADEIRGATSPDHHRLRHSAIINAIRRHYAASDDPLPPRPPPAARPLADDPAALLDGLRALRLGDGTSPPPPSSPVLAFGNIPVDPSAFAANYSNLTTGTLSGDANRYAMPPEAYISGRQQHLCFNSDLSQLRLAAAAARQQDSPLLYSIGASEDPISFRAVADGRYSYRRGGRDVGFANQAPITPGLLQSQQNASEVDLHCGSQVVNGQAGVFPDGWASRSRRSLVAQDIEAFQCGNSLIIPSEGLCYVGNNNSKGDVVKELKKSEGDGRMNLGAIPVVNKDSVYSTRPRGLPISPLSCDSVDAKGYIYYIAKDQHGCRFLQRKFDEGKPQVDVIFAGVIHHVVELMVNPFGNYLMQKLLDVCSEEQRTRIIDVLTEDPAELVKISLNIHGTRAVQKLIETLKTRRQITLVMSALQPGFLDLINDLNGNHVVQRCLQTLSIEENKFLFDAAAKHCVDIATHRHGCCVLQRCIAHSTGKHRANLIAEISSNGLILAQDAFGNYVVQYLLDLKIPSATEKLVLQFKGNFAHLSMQKFSSNVVEKCIKIFGENDKAKIIIELLSFSRFDHLLQDPYANYVIQSALAHSKGSLHAALVEATRPHAEVLRTSPYCKRIFSRTLPKK